MLKTIAAPAPELDNFLEGLELPLNHPQQRHVCQIADGLMTTQGSKTLSAPYPTWWATPVRNQQLTPFAKPPGKRMTFVFRSASIWSRWLLNLQTPQRGHSASLLCVHRSLPERSRGADLVS